MVWKVMLGFVLFLVVVASGLAFYGSQQRPPQQSIEQVLPDNRFPK